jgi:Tfp pilus assembly protein PilF
MTSNTPMTPQLVSTSGSKIRQLIFALSVVAIASFGCAKEEESKEQHLSRANEYVRAEQYDKAEKEYREVLRIAAEDLAALRQLAFIYLDQGQLMQAYPLLKKAAELRPDDPEIQLKLGLLFVGVGSYARYKF